MSNLVDSLWQRRREEDVNVVDSAVEILDVYAIVLSRLSRTDLDRFIVASVSPVPAVSSDGHD